MTQERAKQVKLGTFVLVGVILFIIVLALVGRQQNVFERTFRLQARFSNVEGLQKGSNVWFSGVKIGIVQDVIIESTESVLLELKVGRDLQTFIKKDAKAKIGSDGLLGNKIVIISGGSESAASVVPDDMLESEQGLDTDALMATAKTASENLNSITADLKVILGRIEGGQGSLGSIIQDTVMYRDLKASLASAASASRNTASATRELSQLVSNIKDGEGMVGAILTDTTYENRVSGALADVEKTAQEAAQTAEKLSAMSNDLKALMAKLDNPDAPVGKLLADTTFANTLEESMINLRNSSDELDKTLEAARESFFFRKRILRKNKEEEEKQD